MGYEPTSSSSPNNNYCAVCGKFARGNHHGALSCRGCSAFFRRAATTPNLWKCKKGDGKCDITNMNEPQCKKCRLNKCYSVGMSPRSFQLDRDAFTADNHSISSSSVNELQMASSKVPPSMEIYLGRPHMFIKCEPDAAKSKKFFIDFHNLIDKASEILYTGESKKFDNRSCLENLSTGLAFIKIGTYPKEKGKSNEPKTLHYIGKNEMITFWEHDFLRTTKWLTYFEGFQKLPHKLKMDLIKTIWHVWGYLEKLTITAEMRKMNECTESEIMVKHEIKIDKESLHFDIGWCSSFKPDQLIFFMQGVERNYSEQIVNLLVEMDPSNVELNFLLIQICFTYAARFHKGETLEAIERLQNTVFNEIHDYYVNDLKMVNYAGRLAKLLNVDKLMQMYLREKKKKIEVARLFDIFAIDYSHPETFQDPALC